MSLINLDLSQFKHKSSGKGSTTLIHKDGHEVTLQHSKLHPKAVQQLEALKGAAKDSDEGDEEDAVKMAGGGGVPAYLAPNSTDSSAAPAPAVNTDLSAMPPSQQPSGGDPAYVDEYNKQAMLDLSQTTNQAIGKGDKLAPLDTSQFSVNGQVPANINPIAADRARVAIDAKQGAATAALQSQAAQTDQQNQDRAAFGAPPVPNLAAAELQKQQQAIMAGLQGPATDGVGAQSQGSGQPAEADPFQSSLDAYTKGVGKVEAGIAEGAKAAGDLGKTQAAQLSSQIDAQRIAQNTFTENYGKLSEERQHFIGDLQRNAIDPDKYWDNHSKIAAGIGMVLAGFNPTGRPNAAMEMLQHQMDQNLHAQMANLGTKKSLLEANMHQFGNLRDAVDMTRIMQNEMLSNQLKMSAAKMAGPQAAAIAKQQSGQLEMQTAGWARDMAARRSIMQLSSNGGGGMSDAAIQHQLAALEAQGSPEAKALRERYVPGYTLAQTTVPDAARKSLLDKQQFDSAVADLTDFAKKHTGSVDPSVIAEGKAKALRVQGLYREDVLGTVYRDSEKNLLNAAINSDPTSFFNRITTIPRLNEVRRANQDALTLQAKSLGMRPNVPGGSAPAAAYRAKGFKPVGK